MGAMGPCGSFTKLKQVLGSPLSAAACSSVNVCFLLVFTGEKEQCFELENLVIKNLNTFRDQNNFSGKKKQENYFSQTS